MAERNEDVARALQERFRREAEALAPPSVWTRMQSAFSSFGDGEGDTGASLRPSASSSAAVAPPKWTRHHDGGRGGGGGGDDFLAPGKFQKTSSDCTPDTLLLLHSTSSSCDAPMGRLTLLELERQQQQQQRQRKQKGQTERPQKKRSSHKGSPRSSPWGAPKSSSRNSPTRVSARGSPRGSPRNGFLGPFANASKDVGAARNLSRDLEREELKTRLSTLSTDTVPTLDAGPIRGRDDVAHPSTGAERGRRGNGRKHQRRRGADPKPSYDPVPDDFCGKALHHGSRALLAVLAGGIAFVLYVTLFGRRTSNALDPASWLPGYPEADPSLGTVGEHNVWKPANEDDLDKTPSGLRLQVLNNLVSGSDWNEHLESSIYEWDNGTPDAVALHIRRMAHDPDCRAVRRAMKVCNANYGPTDWRGVNQILLQEEYIITSLAKMNDYYLEGTNWAQKQYTMCHELGHGFGLGHSDENFHNRDLGNCMDYTERPQNNMHPDASNFETLAELYGYVDADVRVQKLRKGSGGRRVSGEEEGLLDDEFKKYASYLLDPIVVASKKRSDQDGGWRLLQKTDTAEFHERQLGNGYSILTSILLP